MTAAGKVDVVVVGAGPAGCAAAITLARAGQRVVVVDRARFPRDKCCGDGLTAAALRHLEALGLDPDTVPSWTPVERVEVRSPSGRTLHLRLPGAGLHAVVAERADLDAALVATARAAGAEIKEAFTVRAVDAGPAGITVRAEKAGPVPEQWEAGYVVAADGAWSPTRKLLGPAPTAPYLGDWHAMRRYLTGTGPAAERMWVWLEPDILPGYAWSFPLGTGRVNFGVATPHHPGGRRGGLGAVMAAMAERPHIAAVLGDGWEPDGPVRAWPIPTDPAAGLLHAAGGRVLFVGDAARVADPLTGEGVAQALATGRAAAASLLTSAGADPVRVGQRYEAAVTAELGADNRAAAALARVIGTPWGARAALRGADSGRWVRDQFCRWMWEDYPRAVLATPRRWGPGLFTPRGAWPDRAASGGP
jgi:geranylgeranyl reductase family protein